MKRLLDTLRFVVVSPELVIGLIVYSLYQCKPSWFRFVGEKLISGNEVTTVLLLSSIGALAWTFQESKSILYPKEENQILLNWPDYLMLRYRVVYGLLLLLICFVVSIGVLFVKSDLSHDTLGLIVILTFFILGAVIVSHALASITVRGIMEREG